MTREFPNLTHVEALLGARPRRTTVFLRRSWPELRRFLDAGHTIRDLHDALREDGVSIHYNNLCALIAELRRRTETTKR